MIRSLKTAIQAVQLPRRYGRYEITVRPREIHFARRAYEWPSYVRSCPFMVCGGNWDISTRHYDPFRSEQMHELFVQRRPYKLTQRYALMISELKQHGKSSAPVCRSPEEIDAYFAKVYRLYEQIKNEGYKKRPPGKEREHQGEITVRISRDGRLLKCNEGTHRLAIATLLKVPSVPVIVDLIHWQWALGCVRKWNTNLENAIENGLTELNTSAEPLRRGPRLSSTPVTRACARSTL